LEEGDRNMSSSKEFEKGQKMLRKLGGDPDQDEVYRIMKEVFPEFSEMTQEWLFGDIWSRPKLSTRDRLIATLAVLQALVCLDELKTYMRYASNNGISKEEIFELIMHVMNYSGWPTGVYGASAATDVFHKDVTPTK
jgi:4-carboxymuconolactone decarboxylase